MDGEIDFTKYSEAELLEVWGRIDPRSAPINCARLKELLVERGYIVQGGTLLPGSATPSPAKLQALIGLDRPISCEVTFGETSGLFGWLAPAHNAFGLVGSGTLTADGVHVQLSDRRAGLFGSVFKRKVELIWKGISDVESDGNVVHFTYRAYLATEGPSPYGSPIKLPPRDSPRFFRKSERRSFIRSFRRGWNSTAILFHCLVATQTR